MQPTTTITVHVPGQLRDRCGGARELEFAAHDVRELLSEIERHHPWLHRGICDETGMVRRHVNVFVNTSNIRDGKGLDTPLDAGDEVIVLPAVSGG